MTAEVASTATSATKTTRLSDRSALLAKSADNVRQLIAYLSGEGKELDEADCRTLLTAIEKIDNLTPDEEVNYWKSYSALVKAALPARVDALSYTKYNDQLETTQPTTVEATWMAQENGSLKRIRRYSIGAFICTLICLAYLSVTDSAIQRNQSISEEFSDLRAGITRNSPIQAAYQAIKEETTSADAAAGGPAEDSAPRFDQTPKEERLRSLIATRKSSLLSSASYNDKVLKFFQFRWISLLERIVPRPGDEPTDASVLIVQQSINALISKYLLPVLAALLGVTVFILRTASAELRTLSFRPNEVGTYSNRLALGVVGGIAISWFVSTDKSGIISSITPAAMAFLVGYSVEVLYNILDALVKALGASDKP